MKIHQLSKKALSVIKVYEPLQVLKLATKAQYLANAIAVIVLMPMCACVFMAFQSKATEQIAFIIFTVLLFLVSLCTWQYKKLLVLNRLNGSGYVETSFFGISLKKEQRFELEQSEVVIKPFPVLNTVFLFSIQDHDYHLGSYAETEGMVKFISYEFGLIAMDGVTDFPNTIPFKNRYSETQQDDSELLECSDQSQVQANQQSKPSVTTEPAKANSQSEFGNITVDTRNLWSLGIILKLILPLPIFLTIGFILQI